MDKQRAGVLLLGHKSDNSGGWHAAEDSGCNQGCLLAFMVWGLHPTSCLQCLQKFRTTAIQAFMVSGFSRMQQIRWSIAHVD